MARQGTNFDLVEGDAVKSGPGRQCINGLFEPSLGSASAYHFHRAILEMGECCCDEAWGEFSCGRQVMLCFTRCMFGDDQ